MVHSTSLTSVHTLVDGSQPVVAITGTFFSPGSQKCVADVLVDGNLVAKGARGTAVGVDYDGNVTIFDEPFNKEIDWSSYKFGLRGAVRVVDGGKVRPNPIAQRFHDSHIWGKAARVGLGLTKSGKLVLFATKEKVTLSELGNAMKSRGVRNGVSLDGGSSTCFYYNGSYLIAPQRKLCNMFIVSQR
jgi:exopolysaccharide biosynthesis protein